MVLGYNFVKHTATVLADDGTTFVVPYRFQGVKVPPRCGQTRRGLINWKYLIDRKEVPAATTADEATAALKIVRSWPASRERGVLTIVLSSYLSYCRERRAHQYKDELNSLYGEEVGCLLNEAFKTGHLRDVPAWISRKRNVANLVNFLIKEVAGLASIIADIPGSYLEAMRAAQHLAIFKSKISALNDALTAAVGDNRDIRDAFKLARFIEARM